MNLQIFNKGWQDVQGVRFNTLQDEVTKDESYDNARIEARNLDDKPCERWSKFRIVEDDGEIRYYYGSDTVTRFQMSKWYLHRYDLVEPTKFLERFFLSGLSCTQNDDKQLKNILFIIDKARQDIYEKYGVSFSINPTTRAKLYNIVCPEYVVTAKTTFFEFLTNYIGKKINAMPRLLGDNRGVFTEITFDYFNEIYPATNLIATSEEISKPQESSATFLEAEVSNMITENEDSTSAITYPAKNMYISVRSDDFVLTKDNADIILPYNIKEIKSIIVRVGGNIKGTMLNSGEIPLALMNEEYDITDQIYTREQWEALPEGAKDQSVRQSVDNKKNTYYYEIGNNKIFNVGGKNEGLLNIGFRSIKAVLERHFKKRRYVYTSYDRILIDETRYADVTGTIAVSEIYLKITYIPYNDKIITTQVNPRNKSLGSLTYNQSAENTNSDEFGKAMWSELQNTNSEIRQVTSRVGDKSEIKQVGDVIDGRIITSVQRRFLGVKWIDVLYTMNEEFIRRSQYIEENREYRPYSIPQETIVDRHLHTNEFCYVDYNKLSVQSPTMFYVEGVNIIKEYLSSFSQYGFYDCKINNVIMNSHDFDESSSKQSLFLISTTSVAIGNSVQFNWKCEDNISVGKYLTDLEEDRAVITKAMYTDILGQREKITIYLLNNLSGIGVTIYFNSLPAIRNGGDYPVATPENCSLYKKTYDNLQKDAGERLMGSIQLHFVTLKNDIVISSNFAKNCPMVSSANKNLKFVLTDYQVNKYTNALPENASIKEVNNVQYYGATINEPNNIYINTGIYSLSNNDVSWAIIDEEKNLYLGGNAQKLLENNGTIYLTFTSRML